MMRLLRRWQVLEAATVAELDRLNKEAKPNTRWQPIDGGRPGYQLLACVEVKANPAAPKAQTPQRPTPTEAPSPKPAPKPKTAVPKVKTTNKAANKTKPKPKPSRASKKKTSSKATRPKK